MRRHLKPGTSMELDAMAADILAVLRASGGVGLLIMGAIVGEAVIDCIEQWHIDF